MLGIIDYRTESSLSNFGMWWHVMTSCTVGNDLSGGKKLKYSTTDWNQHIVNNRQCLSTIFPKRQLNAVYMDS